MSIGQQVGAHFEHMVVALGTWWVQPMAPQSG
jgi:hypothetical protein